MAQGLQCWNAAGGLVVDLGDYNIRYMGTYTITNPPASFTFNIPAMRSTGWFAHKANAYNEYANDYYCICNNGTMTVNNLLGNSVLGTYSFNVYKWAV